VEVTGRRENPMLNRVEISFHWDHPTEPTPSLSMMVEAAARSEPGSNMDLIFVKNVSTRFGMPRTSGLALIYGSAESASIEPGYMKDRHKTQEDKPTDAPVPTESPSSDADESPDESEDGGEKA
tara:strand:- start:1671 stop:2042 length:372 start_codon:yes stop_codon:yes gene_type:complete